MQVYDATTSKLSVRWEPAEGNVREYIVTWVPTAGGESTVVRVLAWRQIQWSGRPGGHWVLSFEQDQVSGSATSTVLQNLDPDTEYTVTVVPVYPEMEGIPQSEIGKTSEFRRTVVRLSSVPTHLSRPVQIPWVE